LAKLNAVTENETNRRQKVGIENLSVDEIQQQLEELAQNQAHLEQALAQRQQQAKYDLAQEIKDLIQDRGYDVAEILSLMSTRRRRSAVAKKSSSRQYTRYVDPDNPENVYVRGVLPGWMKQKMQDQGYDPSSKQDREAFKASSLHVLEG
jgi:DNA-binding protein H-NS